VGYAIRFDARYRAATPLIFATPGMALRWLSQGELERFGTIILDEFHERRWDTDLLLALLRHSSRHRLVVTSATLAGEDLSEYLEAPLIQAEGRRYPVSVRHQARESHDMPDSRKLAERIAAAVRHNLKETDGQILVFLPGRARSTMRRTRCGTWLCLSSRCMPAPATRNNGRRSPMMAASV